jgi:hypothetical protein
MARRMRDAAFRQFQRGRRTDPHIAPINQLVARLQGHDGRGWQGAINTTSQFIALTPANFRLHPDLDVALVRIT